MNVIPYLLIALLIAALAVFRSHLERRGRWGKLFVSLARAEGSVLFALLFALITLGCLQIVLRNFFHLGILWAGPLMQHMVLWIGCLGAALATSRMKHINIDVLSALLPQRLKGVRNRIVYLSSALASFFLGAAALKLVIDERSYGEKAFLNIDTWILQSVLPFTFFLITYRSVLNAVIHRKSGPLAGYPTKEPPGVES